MKTFKEVTWTTGFLTVTGMAVTMELVAALKHDQEVPAWTTLLVRHIPKPIGLAAVGYLCTWLPGHVVKYYKKAGK